MQGKCINSVVYSTQLLSLSMLAIVTLPQTLGRENRKWGIHPFQLRVKPRSYTHHFWLTCHESQRLSHRATPRCKWSQELSSIVGRPWTQWKSGWGISIPERRSEYWWMASYLCYHGLPDIVGWFPPYRRCLVGTLGCATCAESELLGGGEEGECTQLIAW